ncbi:Ubiquinone/menaquinone biosynthesis C-methylase UbiE [Geoalkalibacter ferrihydriticus]|uniref:Methyltransferase type 11 domain-containing protein n=3 Tax=Geoalkalibacter ferrihydriticus TaxID=392333 RepID=A0A0C2HLI1_9BACT|nr:hypothetical protein GFER_14840 [Geoalkalibacter ferrihydriticus DSM 17813]SDM68247.1 Ubiquinone/menaquinone biosynthesis C-methylase UbiE [Geoalkalibacter ferrihydriticus]
MVNPRPTVDEIGRYYPDLYYGEQPFLYEKLDASSRFKQVRRYVKSGDRVLDVGCGRGLVLDKLKNIGCDVVGTELSEHSSKYAREILGIDILRKNLEECSFESGSFDCVTMFHSLEHLYDPLGALREVHRILKPNGRALVEVPRFDSIYSSIFKDKWFHLDVPRHLYHFEDKTLSGMLKKAGFEVVDIKKYAIMYDSFGALQSLLNCICHDFNLLNDLNTKRKLPGDIFQSGDMRQKFDLVLSFAAQGVLYLPMVFLAYALMLFNAGGTLRIWAQKKV